MMNTASCAGLEDRMACSQRHPALKPRLASKPDGLHFPEPKNAARSSSFFTWDFPTLDVLLDYT